ncbi:AmiS/UreI family transporter [Peribacillus deserti]|nr:AmiS/UreI family transporter [Peribacillus deserti]
MGNVGLMLSGAALFLNALMLLGKVNDKSAAVFNLFVGAFQIIAPFYLIVVSDQSNWVVFENAAVFLFGLTYLYVGVTVLKGMNGTGLGYFSLWVSIICLVYTMAAIVHYHDIVNALTWLMWAFLWLLFFLINALQLELNEFVGKVAMVQSWVTLTLPALLSLTGIWEDLYNIWIVILVSSILYFCGVAYKLFNAGKISLHSVFSK